MSYYDYQPPNKFGYKDQLPEGDDEKIIKGSEFDDEFKKISAESQAIDQAQQESSDRLDEEIENRIEGDQNLQNQINSLIDGSISIEPDQIEGLPEYLDENYVNKVTAEDQQILSKLTFSYENPLNGVFAEVDAANQVFNLSSFVQFNDNYQPWEFGLRGKMRAEAPVPMSSATTHMNFDSKGMGLDIQETGNPFPNDREYPAYVRYSDGDNKWNIKPDLDVDGKLWVNGTDITQELIDIEAGLGAVSGQIVFGGTYDPNTGLVVKANLSDFEEGQPLPNYEDVQGKFVICIDDGTNPVPLGEGDWLVAGESGWVPINYISDPGVWKVNGDKIYYDEGNVGIGLDNPKTELNISQSANAPSSGIRITGPDQGSAWTLSKTDNNFDFSYVGQNDDTPQDWKIRFETGGHVNAKLYGHFREPDDYWGTSGWYGIGQTGALASNGTTNVLLTSGGYRGPNNEWRSINNAVAASQLQLNNNNGNMFFRTALNKADGDGYAVSSRMTILGTGEVGIGMTPSAATADAQIALWQSELEAVLEENPDLEVKAAVRQATEGEFEVMPTEAEVSEWLSTRVAGDTLQVGGPTHFKGRMRVSEGGIEAVSIYRQSANGGGILFDSDGYLRPCDNTGTGTNGVLDIGRDTQRFNDGWFKGTVTADKFVKDGGTSAQLLCADGSVVAKSSVGSSTDLSNYYTKTEANNAFKPKSYKAPVDSVNGKTGVVSLTASDVGALPSSYTPPAAPVQSVNGKTGKVTLTASDVGASTFSGNYNDLTNKPNVADSPWTDNADGIITEQPVVYIKGSANAWMAHGNKAGLVVESYDQVGDSNPPNILAQGTDAPKIGWHHMVSGSEAVFLNVSSTSDSGGKFNAFSFGSGRGNKTQNTDWGGSWQYASMGYIRNMRINGTYYGQNVFFRDSPGVTARDLIDVFVALKDAVSSVNESDPVAAMSSMRSAITATSDSLIQKFEAIHEAVADELEVRRRATMEPPEGVDGTTPPEHRINPETLQ